MCHHVHGKASVVVTAECIEYTQGKKKEDS